MTWHICTERASHGGQRLSGGNGYLYEETALRERARLEAEGESFWVMNEDDPDCPNPPV